MASVLSLEELGSVLAAIRGDGRTVIGPVRSNGTITLDEIESLDDLPAGWVDEQDAGRFRLAEIEQPALFAHATPAMPWKRWLYPERSLLMRATRSNGDVTITQPEPQPERLAFFGIRSCDLVSLDILDKVFLDPVDPYYEAARKDIFIVAAACARPGGTCFCASMETGPAPKSGYDLSITEICTEARHVFLVDTGTDEGAALLGAVTGREATEADLAAAAALISSATKSMGRTLDPTHPTAAAGHLDHRGWEAVAKRCLSCTNCTMVCPTCFCSTTEDTTDLAGAVTERWRTWHSCFSLDFSYLHGGPVRTSISSRYRQWLLHKLVTWHEQFGTSGCVGCGRCITWCPVGIDLTAEIAAIAQDPAAQPTGGGS